MDDELKITGDERLNKLRIAALQTAVALQTAAAKRVLRRAERAERIRRAGEFTLQDRADLLEMGISL